MYGLRGDYVGSLFLFVSLIEMSPADVRASSCISGFTAGAVDAAVDAIPLL